VTISGSGMSFSSQSGFSLGDLLEIKIMMNLYKPAAFYLYGEVIRAQRQTSGYFIAVSFRMIDDGIRDRIIRFVFETERELLRERSKIE
jgi:c-di-GMP-binding flagellar brake protein YcgR